MQQEIRKTTAQVCKTCVYSKVFSGGMRMCDYLGMTRKRRDCPVGYCDKYKTKSQMRRKANKDECEM